MANKDLHSHKNPTTGQIFTAGHSGGKSNHTHEGWGPSYPAATSVAEEGSSGSPGCANCVAKPVVLPTYLIISIDDFATPKPNDNHAGLAAVVENEPTTFFPYEGYDKNALNAYKAAMANKNIQYGWHGRGVTLDVNPSKTHAGINKSVIAWAEGQVDSNAVANNVGGFVARGTRGAANNMASINLRSINSFSLGDSPISKKYPGSKESPQSKITDALKAEDKLVSVHLHSGRANSIEDLKKVLAIAKSQAHVEIIYQSQVPAKKVHNNNLRNRK